MRPRQDLIQLFSTFLQFDADRPRGWATDGRLRRSMEGRIAQSPQPGEQDWALYWHHAWQTQTNPLAQAHLSAYLQEVCYWAAQKLKTHFENTQDQISDYFQIAIARLDKVLRGFAPTHSLSLKSYASLTFSSVIKDTLRQRQVVDVCTPWALLNKLSKKRLLESLQNAGLNPEIIDRYVLAWICFNASYAPQPRSSSSRSLSKPEPALWEAIAKLYNQQRQTLQPVPPAASPSELETWLTASTNAARRYLYPTAISIHAPLPGQAEGELLDRLPEAGSDSGLDALIAQEESGRLRDLNRVLLRAIDQLDADSKQVLDLYYLQELTQQQIAQQLAVKQYVVSRRLSRIKRSLQRQLAEWSRDTLHISLNLDVLDSISTALEEWLNVHYRRR